MNNPLGVSPSKGNQGTTRGKEKIFSPRWELNPRPRFFLYLVWFPDSLPLSERTKGGINLYIELEKNKLDQIYERNIRTSLDKRIAFSK